jgi:hypothetical protein
MKKIIGYTIESSSPDGVYYLVNGWYKYFAFWIRKKDFTENKTRYLHMITFKTKGSAKASLTKLLKIMPDYATDKFYLCEIHAGGYIINVPFINI